MHISTHKYVKIEENHVYKQHIYVYMEEKTYLYMSSNL